MKGGAPVSLYEAATTGGFGGNWAEDDTIVFAAEGKLFQASAAGGTPRKLAAQGGDLAWPQVLPGARTVLFTDFSSSSFDSGKVEAFSLKTGAQKTVLTGGYHGRYVASSDGRGYLLYLREGTLFGAAFDPGRLEMRGTPVPLLEDLARSTFGGGQFDISRSGTLVYMSGDFGGGSYPVVWLDSNGKTTP